jgi:tripartite-type tricarboxylate transporter receptor subunit TctC
MLRRFLCSGSAAAAALWVAAWSEACAQSTAAPFYQGKTVTIMVGSSPGGGYDLYARLIARHLGKHIPGNPTMVVSNMPGAASNVLAAHIYNVAPKDGTVIGAIFMGAVVEPLFGQKTRATHDTSRFSYIGNANKDVYVCLVRSDAGVRTFADVLEKELVVGGTAEGASTRDFPLLLKNLLGARFKIVTGYAGTREINLAMERGEVQGGCGQTWSSVAAIYPSWFREGKIKVLVQEDSHGYPELNTQGVPLARQFAKSEDQARVLDLIYSQTNFGRPYVVAPEVPRERVDMLRRAFMATMQDGELVAEARRMQVDVMPVSGEDLQAMIARMYATPKDLLETARQAMAARQN